MLRILVIGLVILVLALMLSRPGGNSILTPEVATVLPQARELPQVAFADQTGQAFSTGDLAGRFSLLFFGFTHCPDICPLTLQVLADARAEIESRVPGDGPNVVFVSVDPNRDTPERIDAYINNFDPSFIGVTAADTELAPLLDMLAVTVHITEQNGESYNVVHNGTIYVLDASARWVALFGGSSHDAATVATDFLRIRQRIRMTQSR